MGSSPAAGTPPPELKPDATLHKGKQSRLKWAIGIVALIFVVIGWVGTGILTQAILNEYNKPFLMTVLSCFCLQFYFVFVFFGDPLKSKEEKPSAEYTPPLTIKETAVLALLTSVLYFGMNYFTNMSFVLTSIGSASILASTCGFFTLVVGRIAGVEKLTLIKLMATLVSAAGVVILGISEFSGSDTKGLGNAFAIVGAVLYGINSTVLKLRAGDESRISTLNMFAFVGLYVTIFSPPFFYLLHKTGIETFELPERPIVYLFLFINILFGSLIPNYLWNVAFAYTSQLVVAIGISFTTPLTLLWEYIVAPETVTWQKVASAACIIIGFGIVNYAEMRPERDMPISRLLKCGRK